MIALLTGEIAHKSVEKVIVDVSGVGYALQIPLSTFYLLPETGAVRLHVHTHVREDALQLFGFLSPGEKELFLLLLSVSGIGPKVALGILSHASCDDLQGAIGHGDVKRLSALPGIGKKTAERLILELQEKIRKLHPQLPVHSETPLPTATEDAHEDALSALVNLGYKEPQARKVLNKLDLPSDTPLEQVLKEALRVLMR